MNELQSVQFEMLKSCVEIFDKLNLMYYLVCGSALGAAKYQGFIPWDDDLDIALPRKDYELFCKKGQQLLPKNLFLQNNNTDFYYPLIFSKVRNSETTYIEKNMSNRDIHHGVYIDIFPLDGYPESVDEQRKLEVMKRKYDLALISCLSNKYNWKVSSFIFVEKMFGIDRDPQKFVNKLEKYISSYSLDDSKIWCNHGNWQGKLEYAPQEQYGNGVWSIFEGLKVRIPEKYDEYLTQKYGDWRADLPEEQKVGHHYYEICDLNRPYTDYINDRKNGKIHLRQI
ncbi:MAG: LicD family protein [Clostridiales bacterium]|nr:LicD family protein [Clostridiales bacterium]